MSIEKSSKIQVTFIASFSLLYFVTRRNDLSRPDQLYQTSLHSIRSSDMLIILNYLIRQVDSGVYFMSKQCHRPVRKWNSSVTHFDKLARSIILSCCQLLRLSWTECSAFLRENFICPIFDLMASKRNLTV